MNELDKAEDRLKHFSTPFSDDSLAAARSKVMARTVQTKEVSLIRGGFSYKQLYAAAAALAIIVSAPFGIYYFGNTTLTAEQNSGTHRLPDGSEINLAKGSSLSYNSFLWDITRMTQLEGEAFFSVTDGEQFTVETSYGDVKVLGTRFSIWENEDALVVQCQEGRVDVEGEILTANEYIIKSAKDSQLGQWDNKERFISNNSSELTFDNTPMQIVIESLEEKFGQDIRFTSKGVYRFSGSLDANDFESSLEILTKPFGLEISSDKSGVVILEP